MAITLFEIAFLIAGYSFRGKMPFDGDGKLSVVQMKDINERGDVDTNRLDRIVFQPQYEKHLLRPGDVPLLSRGSRTTALLVTDEWADTIVPSYFTVIRVKDNTVLPGYLRAFLNHPKTQARFREMAQGTTIHVLSSEMLARLSVTIPPMETQQIFAELDILDRQANRIEMEIQKKRRALLEQKMARFFM